eukprot:7113663-Pyramimonas_sp.AAC.1
MKSSGIFWKRRTSLRFARVPEDFTISECLRIFRNLCGSLGILRNPCESLRILRNPYESRGIHGNP